jgi:hypothetical protein
MAEIPSSSFIPRQNQSAVPTRIRRRHTLNIFSFVSTTILLGSLILAGGTFFYKERVAAQRDDMKSQLTAQEGLFNDADIFTVQRFDRQIRAAKHLLQNHIAPSKIFAALEGTAMDRIQYTSLDLSYDPGFEVEINVVGGTEEFKTVALQALAFKNQTPSEKALFKDAIFSEIGTTETSVTTDKSTGSNDGGNEHAVNFSITGVVAPALLGYDGIDVPLPVSAFNTLPPQEGAGQIGGTEPDVINQDTL